MFKRKKKEEEEVQEQETPVVIDPIETPSELPPPQFQQPVQQQPVPQISQEQVQQAIQQNLQPIQQVPQLGYQQQIQPIQQAPQRIACVVQGAIVEPGAYRYVIDTNYPLAIGNCEIAQ